jgi:hypothetical protein
VWCSPRQELAEGVAESDRRRRRAAGTVGVCGQAAAGVAGILGLRRSAPGTPAEATRRLRGPAVCRRQAIAATAVLTYGGLREKFRPKNRPESRVKGAGAPG